MRQYILTILAELLLAGFLFATPVSAQGFNLPLALSLEASPASPAPGQTVTVKAATPTLDTATTFFDWSINRVHKPELSGYGSNTIRVASGDVGTSVRIDVVVTGRASPDLHDKTGVPAQSSLTIYPSTISLSWYAQTYVPAWYKGKALPTPNSVVTVVATPHIVLNGTSLNPDNLVYTWGFENRDRLLTGVGKRSFAVQTTDQTDVDQQVRVTVEDIDRRIHQEQTIFITTTLPRAAIYQLTPLGGIDPRIAASAQAAFRHETIDLQAEPFFFPTLSKKNMQFQWTIGGLIPQGNPQNPFITTVEAGDPNLGSLSVSADVSQPQPDNLVARAVASVLMFFK